MRRQRSILPFLTAAAAGAATVAGAMQYTRHRQAAKRRLAAASEVIQTQRGPVEYAAAGDGPAVLALHGTLGGYDQGLAGCEPLSDAGYQVIAPSRPGYLRTPPIADMTSAGQADLNAALLDALKIKESVVIAFSGGGPSAIEFAVRYPDRCRALILICAVSQRITPDPATETQTTWMFRSAIGSDFMTWLAIEISLKTLPLAAAGQENWQARLMADRARLAKYDRMMWTVFPAKEREAGSQNDLDQFAALPGLPFKKVKAPTLVLHGTDDTLVPFEHGENSARLIAGARFIPVAGGEHGFFLSHDDVVWPEVIRFLHTALQAPVPKKKAAKKPAATKAPSPQTAKATGSKKPVKRPTAKRKPATRP